MPPPPPQSTLPEELAEEVLLRLPPESPASLVRAGLVCKQWCHLISNPIFQRRFREFHRSPPLLGFLYDRCDSDFSNTHTCFVPMSSSCPPHAGHYGMRPQDSRHGRILFRAYRSATSITIIIWDPVTDERQELPKPPPPFHNRRWAAAVFCTATLSGTCDHLDCHGQPFTVVLMFTVGELVFSCVYTSEAGTWSDPTFVMLDGACDRISYWQRSALVGNLLYFVCAKYKMIVEYDLFTRKIYVIDLPDPLYKNEICPTFVELTTTEAGQLGFARVENFKLCLWSKEVEDERWTQIRAIDIDKLRPHGVTWTQTRPYLVGSAEGVGVIFLSVDGELFTIDLRSDRVTKVDVAPCPGVGMVIPYVNFCTPELMRVPTKDDGPRVSASNA